MPLEAQGEEEKRDGLCTHRASWGVDNLKADPTKAFLVDVFLEAWGAKKGPKRRSMAYKKYIIHVTLFIVC